MEQPKRSRVEEELDAIRSVLLDMSEAIQALEHGMTPVLSPQGHVLTPCAAKCSDNIQLPPSRDDSSLTITLRTIREDTYDLVRRLNYIIYTQQLFVLP